MNKLHESILRCKVAGNIVSLPPMSESPLENYGEVKKAFLNAGAVYKRNTFVFPSDAQPYIDRLTGGEKVNIKKEFQFLGTPEKLADRLVELAEIKQRDRILEPSAGQGAIIKAILRDCEYLENEVDYFELIDMNIQIVQKMDSVSFQGEDFLTGTRIRAYDKIIANPPFNKNQDIDHIRKMYEVCKVGGRIVTIASNSWRTGSQKKQVEFREWLDSIDAEITDVPAGEFKESGTNVASCIIVINKI